MQNSNGNVRLGVSSRRLRYGTDEFQLNLRIQVIKGSLDKHREISEGAKWDALRTL
jgi:hypothetical protein